MPTLNKTLVNEETIYDIYELCQKTGQKVEMLIKILREKGVLDDNDVKILSAF